MLTQFRRTLPVGRRRAFAAVILAVAVTAVSGCSSGSAGEGLSRQRATTEAPSSPEAPASSETPSFSTNETTPTTSQAATPLDSEVDLPSVPTAQGVRIRTGGKYVDADGYTAQIAITLYAPVGLDSDVSQELEICPDQVDPGTQTGVVDQILENGLKTKGGIAWAFKVAVTSPDPKFPFPLAARLSDASGEAFASSRPSLGNTDFPPQYKVSQTCVVDQTDSSATWIGFTSLLPEDTSTPNNPDGKLPADPQDSLDLTLHDPLFDLTNDLGSPWAKEPDTSYGPVRGGLGDNGWMFDFSAAPFKDRFLTS